MTDAWIVVRRLLVVPPMLWLIGCGGGGDGGGGATTTDIGARLSATTLVVERDLQQRNATAPLKVSLLVDRPPAGPYYFRYRHTNRAIAYTGDTLRAGDAGIDFEIGLSAPGVLPLGSYDDSFTVDVCSDQVCAQPVRGSPFTVAVRLVVGYFAPAEVGVAPLVVASSVTLPHDLVDASYSAALDAIVTVSTRPAAALNLHYLSSGLTRSVPLATLPTAVTLAPGGLRAAVGHDAAISVVDLLPTDSAGAMQVTRYAVSLPVGELVFDGFGRVHAFGNEVFNRNPIHTLDVATGIDTRSSANSVMGVAHAVLHPSGERLYFADRNVSPDDIFSIRLPGGLPAPMVDSPYHGEYAICGRVWVSADGARLYTACGSSFLSSQASETDMRYAGTMALSGASRDYAAVSLSDNASRNAVVLLEQSRLDCDPRLDRMIDCFTRLSTFSASTLEMSSRFSLPPITVGGDRFAQTGRYVFHRSNGLAVMLSELRNAPDPTTSVRLSRLP